MAESEEEAETIYRRLRFLTQDLIEQIDAALAEVGDYGEITLVVRQGRLRYINSMQSHKVSPDGADAR